MHAFLLGIGQLDSLSLPTTTYTSHLKQILIKKSLTFHHLFRILVIALWVWKRESDKRTKQIEPTNEENNALEIIAALLNALIGALIEFPELSTARYMPHCEDSLFLLCISLF